MICKKSIILLLVTANIQFCIGQVSLGAKGGINFNKLNFSQKEFKSEDTRYGFVLGGWIRFRVTNLTLQPELLYSQKGGIYSYSTTSQGFDTLIKSKINYFDVPLIFGYHLNPNINLHTGPVFNFLVKEKIEFGVEGTSIHSNISGAVDNDINFGWQIGVGLEIKRVSFILRYEFAIYKSFDNIQIPYSDVVLKPDARNNLWQFAFGYRLFSTGVE